MPARSKREPTASLGEQAYIAFKRLILTRDLKPGEHVNVAQLSEQLGLGKNPIHLAAHRLAREGLVEILPRKGILVRAETLDSFLELIAARELVEPYLTAEAVDYLTPEVVERLEALIERGWRLQEAGDRLGAMEVDRLFHQTVYAAANNELLADFAGQLLDRSMRLWFTPAPDSSEPSNMEQLATLLETMKRKDKQATAEQMKAHIGSIRKKFLR
ncbi:GntR family transcriptional regulator [Achromobacter sp. F4_2707]|uniref:GntR family transcriptional regulator n=1 Tax=Achromobacter sp. F4_2707 TaxID=3114286 RepID=UPI0039C68BD9